MRNIHILSLLFVFLTTTLSCNKNEALTGIYGIVELYEIEQFETIDNTDQIDESTIIIKKNPLLNYDDLLTYDSKEYNFKISESGMQLFEEEPVKSGAFAIMANDKLIYTGYFVPGYSSRIWFWNIIDPLKVGYSGDCYVRRIVDQAGNQPIYKDKRNDPIILEVFRRDGKLIE